MMLPSWAGKRRDANEAEIAESLRKAGASVFRLHCPVDLLVGHRGRNYLMECKTPSGSFTAPELAFQREWRGRVDIVRSAEEALRLIGAIT